MKLKAGSDKKRMFNLTKAPQFLPWREADLTDSSRLNRKQKQGEKNHIKPLRNEDRRMSQCQLFGEKAQHYHRTFNNKINDICLRCTKIGLLFTVYILN